MSALAPGISTYANLRKPDVAVAQVGVNSTKLDICYKLPLGYLYKLRYYSINANLAILATA